LHVVIIGGGPAGSSAAIWCSKLGIEVTLLEGEGVSGIKPGEALHPGLQAVFKQLEVDQDIEACAIVRHSATWVKWNEDLKLVSFGSDKEGPWLGYQLLRTELNAILKQKAQSLGARILQPCRAMGLELQCGKITAVKTSGGHIKADFVVDAAGPSHWIARKLNLKIERYSPSLFVYYGYVKGSCPARDHAPAFIATPNGWIWTAKVHRELYQWTRLDFVKTPIPNDWLPNEFGGGKLCTIHQSIHGADVTWRRVVGAAGSGYFIVGDAAAVLDPASSHGVLRAIMSGIMAGYAINKIVSNGFVEKAAAYEYEKWFSEWFFYDLANLRKLYYQHPHPPKWVEPR
jgi:flavin-dependent dehydrogenase